MKEMGRAIRRCRLPRRLMSTLSVTAILLALIPAFSHTSVIPAAAEEDTGNFVFEAEERVNGSGDIIEVDGVKAVRLTVGGPATFGNSFSFPKGKYKVTARMQQIGGDFNNKSTPFGYLSILDKVGQPLYMYSVHNTMFAAQNTWTDIDFYIDVPQDLSGVQLCMNNHSNNVCHFLLDKYTITRLPDDAPIIIKPDHMVAGDMDGMPNTGTRTAEGVTFAAAGGGGGLWCNAQFEVPVSAGNHKIRIYFKQLTAPSSDNNSFAFLAIYHDGTKDTVLNGDWINVKPTDYKTQGEFQYVDIDLNVPDNVIYTLHELRFFYTANGDMLFSRYEILSEGSVIYEAEAGRQDPYEQVTDGDVTAVKADRDTTEYGHISQIQGVNLPKGHYKITARMKMLSNSDGSTEGHRTPFGYMSLRSQDGQTILFQQSMHLAQLSLNDYQDVDFYINPDTDITNAQLWLSTHDNVGSFLFDKFVVTRLPFETPLVVSPYHFADTTGDVKGNVNPNGIDYVVAMGEGASISGGGQFTAQMNAGSHSIRVYLNQFSGRTADGEASIVSFKFTYKDGAEEKEAGPFAIKQKDIPLGAGLVPVDIPFEVPVGKTYKDFDIHVTYHAVTDLTLNRFEITTTPFFVYEAEERGGGQAGTVVEESGVKSVRLPNTGGGVIVFGSKFMLERGTYKVSMRIKVFDIDGQPDNFNLPIGHFFLNDPFGTMRLSQTFRLNQLDLTGQWADVDFYINPTETMQGMQLCLNIFPNPITGMDVDKFIVTKLENDAPIVLQPGHFTLKEIGSFTSKGVESGTAEGSLLTNGAQTLLQLDEGNHTLKLFVNQLNSVLPEDEDTPIFQVEYSYNDGAEQTLAPIVFTQKDLVYPQNFDFESQFVEVNAPISVPKGKVFRDLRINIKLLNATALRINRMEFLPANFFVYEAENGRTIAGMPFTDPDGTRGYAFDRTVKPDGGNILHGSSYSLKAGMYTITARMMVYNIDRAKTNQPFGFFYISDGQTGAVNYFMQSLHTNLFGDEENVWKDIVFYVNPDTDLSNLQLCFHAHNNQVTSFKIDKLTVEGVADTTPMVWLPGHFTESATGNFAADGSIEATTDMNEGVLLNGGAQFIAQLNSGKHDIRFFVSQSAKAAKDSDAIFTVTYSWQDNGAAGATEAKTIVQTLMPEELNAEEAVNIPLEVPAGHVYRNFNIKIEYGKKSPLRLSRVEVRPGKDDVEQDAVDVSFPAKTSGAEDGTRTVLEDGIEHKPINHAAGIISKNNYLSLPAGEYRAAVYAQLLEAAADSAQIPLNLQLINRETGQAAVSRDITAKMLGSKRELKPVVIPFILEEPIQYADIRLLGKDLLGVKVTKIDVYSSDGGVTVIEAEDPRSTMTEGTGERTENSLISDPAVHKEGHIFNLSQNNLFEVRPGQNRMVVRMRLLEEAPNISDRIATIDVGYVEPAQYVGVFNKILKAGTFKKLGEYVDIVVEMNAKQTYINKLNVFIWNDNHAKFEVDKITYYDEAAWTALYGQPEEEPVYKWECEDMNSVTGINTGDGVICGEGMRPDHAAFTDYIEMPANNWKGVIYMKLLSKTGLPNTVVTTFGCYSSTGNRQSVTEIKESQFPELDVYYPIVVNFNNVEDILWYLYINYDGVNTVKYDKFYVLYPDMEVPEATQEAPDDEKRPEGIPAHDNYEVPLTPENIILSNSESAEVTNGTILFDTGRHTPGSVKGLREKIYMTSGKKIARFYLRSQGDTGFAELIQLSVMQGYLPLGTSSLQRADFADYDDKSFVVDIPITCDENKAIDIKIEWFGSKNIAVEKIVIKTDDAVDYKTHTMTVKLDANGAGTLRITPETMKGINPIDRVIIEAGDRKMFVTASDLIKWLGDNDSLDVVFGMPSAANAAKMREYASAIGDNGETISVFDLHIIQRSAKNGDVAMTDGVFDIQMPIAAELFAGSRWDYLFPVACNLTDAGDMEVLKPIVAAGRQYVTISSTTFGSFHVELFDLTETIYAPGKTPAPGVTPGNPEDPSGGGSPGTGVALPLTAAAVAGLAGLTAGVARRRKRGSV